MFFGKSHFRILDPRRPTGLNIIVIRLNSSRGKKRSQVLRKGEKYLCMYEVTMGVADTLSWTDTEEIF